LHRAAAAICAPLSLPRTGAAALRIALLTFESLVSAEAVRRFVADHAGRIALVALSDPLRQRRLAEARRTWRLLRRSGPRLLPYLLGNFVLPRLAPRPVPGLPARAAAPERTPLPRLCRRLGLPCVPVPDCNAPGFQAALAASGAELIVTFHFDQILAPATIAAVPRGGINVHPGALPAQRGPVPTLHALLEPAPRFAVTLHRLVARIDAGPILAQQTLPLPPGTTALEAARQLHLAALPLLDATLARLAAGEATARAVAPLPYCGFPAAAELRRLAATGRRLADRRDLWRALCLPA
jgi:methionyl-tRNA formyltransferase